MYATTAVTDHQSFHQLLQSHLGLQPGDNKVALIAANQLSRRVANLIAFMDPEQPLVTTGLLRDIRTIMIGIHTVAILVDSTPWEAMLTKWSKKGYDTSGYFISDPDFPDLTAAIRDFYNFRYSATHGYPSAYHSASFLLSEVGELVAELLQSTGEFIRNYPEKSQGNPTIYELGDVYQMFLVTCIQLGVDPFEPFQ